MAIQFYIFSFLLHLSFNFQVEIHQGGKIIHASGNIQPIQIIRVERRTNLNPNKESIIMTKIANIDAAFDAMIQRHVEIYFNFLNGIGKKQIEGEQQKEEEIGDIDVSLDEEEPKEKKNNSEKSNENNSNKNNEDKPKEDSSLVVTPITKGDNDKVMTSKQKKKQIQHERKKILFSKICKYIFYLLILFTCYFTVKQFLYIINLKHNPESISQKQETQINEEEETKEMLEMNEQNKRHPNKLK